MTEGNDQSIKVEVINNEVLGESITFKGMEVQGRFDDKTG